MEPQIISCTFRSEYGRLMLMYYVVIEQSMGCMRATPSLPSCHRTSMQVINPQRNADIDYHASGHDRAERNSSITQMCCVKPSIACL
jgi:hypothetical protein